MKKKIISWVLAVASMLTCVSGLSACTNPGEQSSNGGNNPVEVDGSSSNGRLPNANLASDGTPANINGVARNDGAYKGTHIYTATDTNNYLLQNGATDYVLVIDADLGLSSTDIKVNTIKNLTDVDELKPAAIAVYEFIKLFYDATGLQITVKKDTSSTYKYSTSSDSVKFISLGRTKQLESAEAASKIDTSQETLSNDGHVIKTIGNDVYLCGGTDEGTVFSVYTFMRLNFNYETYYYDCTEIDRVSTLKMKNYDVKDIPDFKFRAHSTDVTTYDSTTYDEDIFAWRLKYYGKDGNRGYYWMPIHEEWDTSTGNPAAGSKSSGSTNIRRWFPERLYNDPVKYPNQYHPKWFSSQGGSQVCFSAHGDPVEYEAMVNAAFEKVKAQLKYYTPDKYPHKNVMSITHEDNRNYCKCDACREISGNNRDSQAAVQILFMNDLAAKVNEYMNLSSSKSASWYREDLKLLMFAYNHNMDAPAQFNAQSQQYEATDERMYVNDRVIVWFARDANGQEKFNSTRNGEMVTNLECWNALANNIYFWNYGTNFTNFMVPYDSFEFATPEMYAYFCNKSDKFWFTQLQDNNPNTNTAWHNLKAYLEAKLSWDTSLDMDDLIENWFRAMYGDGAETMYNLFKDVRNYQHETLVGEYKLVAYGDGSPDVVKAEYWPMDMLQDWLSEIDTAKNMVSDTKIKNRMEAEALSNLYLLMQLHSGSLTSSQKRTYKNRLTTANTTLHLEKMKVDYSKILFPDWLASLS